MLKKFLLALIPIIILVGITGGIGYNKLFRQKVEGIQDINSKIINRPKDSENITKTSPNTSNSSSAQQKTENKNSSNTSQPSLAIETPKAEESTSIPNNVVPVPKESFLLANDGQYLGKLTSNKYDSKSVLNTYGNYGSHYSSTSIFNQYSNYGSPYSNLSAYNPYTSTPPVIYINNTKYGFLTKNKYLGLNSVDPDFLLIWLENNNL